METPVTAETALSEESIVQTQAIPNNWIYWVAGLTTTVLASESVQLGSQQSVAFLLIALLFMWGFVRQ